MSLRLDWESCATPARARTSRRRPGAVARRQRLAGATVLALAVAFIWSGVPELLAAQIVAARLGFADAVVLLFLAALLTALVVVVVLLLLVEVFAWRDEWAADRRAEEDRRVLRVHVEPAPVGPVLSSHDLEDLMHRTRGMS